MNPARRLNAAYEQEYLDWYQHTGPYAGVPFDSRTFAQLVREQYPTEPAWADAMERCDRAWHTEWYTTLYPPYENKYVRHRGSFWLQHPQLGKLLVDHLQSGDIAGIEYWARLGRENLEPLEHVLNRLVMHPVR